MVKAAPGASIESSSWHTTTRTQKLSYGTTCSLPDLPANISDELELANNCSPTAMSSVPGSSCEGVTQCVNTGSFQDAITCPYCPKVFPRGKFQSYQRHVIVHTGFKPFACKHCEYKGNQASNLRRHERLKHSEIYFTDDS